MTPSLFPTSLVAGVTRGISLVPSSLSFSSGLTRVCGGWFCMWHSPTFLKKTLSTYSPWCYFLEINKVQKQ